jgi:hypothetical protein
MKKNCEILLNGLCNFFSDWLLRKVLQLKEGELATIEKLDNLGFDSVIITKSSEKDFKIDIMRTNSYEEFIRTFS